VRTALLSRVFRRCLAPLGVALLLPGLPHAPVFAVAAAPSVSVASHWEWIENMGPVNYVHLGGEVFNNETARRAGLIDVHYTVNWARGPSAETVHVWEMGADILDANQTTPYQEIFPEPDGYSGSVLDPQNPVTATDPLTPSDHLFTVLRHDCPDVVDSAHVCGTVTNNNSTTVDNIRVILSFRHTDTNGVTTTVDEDSSQVFTGDAMNSLGAGLSADFQEVVRSPQAPAAENVLMFAESPITAPGRATDVAATFGNASATVSWTPPVDGGRAITGYTVTAAPGGQSVQVSGSVSSATITGLINGQTYTFTVVATNPVGSGDASDPSNAVMPGAVPDPPTQVSATAGLRSATVSWNAPSAEGRPITQYNVTSSPGGGVTTVSGNPPATSTEVSGLQSGTSYTFTVTATNQLGMGPPSAPSNAVTPYGPPPLPTTAPTDVRASAGFGYATVNWTAATSDPSTPVTSYTIAASPGPVALTAPGSATSVVVGGLKRGTYTFTVTATTAGGSGPTSAPSNPAVIDAGGQYHPLVPVRIVDTRDGTGNVRHAPLGPGGTMDVPIRSNPKLTPVLLANGVDPSAVAAVVMNVTVTQGTAPSYLSVYPTGSVQTLPPKTSSLNFVYEDVPNLVFATLGNGGAVTAYNAAGSVHVIFDVQGWISTPDAITDTSGQLQPIVPNRILDTRGNGALGQTPYHLQVAGTLGVPAMGSGGPEGVVLNLTVTNPTAPSFVTLYPSDAQRPGTSNLNFVPGLTRANRVTVKLGPDGAVDIFNAGGTADVIIDVNGWFTDRSNGSAAGGQLTGLNPARILDTRDGTGGFHTPVAGGTAIQLQVSGQGGVPNMGGAVPPSAVVLNVTATDTTAAGYLRVYPYQGTPPNTSDLNWMSAGRTVPNLVVVKLNGQGQIGIFNSSGSTDVVVDVLGWYSAPPPQ